MTREERLIGLLLEHRQHARNMLSGGPMPDAALKAVHEREAAHLADHCARVLDAYAHAIGADERTREAARHLADVMTERRRRAF